MKQQQEGTCRGQRPKGCLVPAGLWPGSVGAPAAGQLRERGWPAAALQGLLRGGLDINKNQDPRNKTFNEIFFLKSVAEGS